MKSATNYSRKRARHHVTVTLVFHLIECRRWCKFSGQNYEAKLLTFAFISHFLVVNRANPVKYHSKPLVDFQPRFERLIHETTS